jgi:hypothetical protein
MSGSRDNDELAPLSSFIVFYIIDGQLTTVQATKEIGASNSTFVAYAISIPQWWMATVDSV